MTVQAKAIVSEYYGSRVRLSYWNGCSSGGKQGLKEAQKFPDDYDGVIAGAPANNWTHLVAQAIWIAQATLTDPAATSRRKVPGNQQSGDRSMRRARRRHRWSHRRSRALPVRSEKYAVRRAGWPDVPDSAAGGRRAEIYEPLKNPRTGATIYPGLAPGSETGWGALAGGPQPFTIAADHFKYVVFKDPAWDFKTFDVDKDVAAADRIDGGSINATDPNMNAFFTRGGKILMYHGWIDQLISPATASTTTNRSPRRWAGRRTLVNRSACSWCPGWRTAPAVPGRRARLSQRARGLGRAEKGAGSDPRRTPHWRQPDRTRPLCPYPLVATYSGTGSTDDAASFVCRAR